MIARQRRRVETMRVSLIPGTRAADRRLARLARAGWRITSATPRHALRWNPAKTDYTLERER